MDERGPVGCRRRKLLESPHNEDHITVVVLISFAIPFAGTALQAHQRADLTGIMLSKGVSLTSMTGDSSGHSMDGAHLVAPYVSAPHHQHFFNFRLP